MKDKKKILINNINDTIRFAENLAKNAKPLDIFCLKGDLGVGKTVIAKSIGKFFNVDTDIISPTFNIIKTYKTNNKKIKKINHFDLYRIKSEDDLINIGFEEYIYDDNAINIIEWPEIAEGIIPKNAKWIEIKKLDNDEFKREIIYEI